jgi:translation initiation factor IF-3
VCGRGPSAAVPPSSRTSSRRHHCLIHPGATTIDTPHRLNEQIRITPIRVVSHDGEMLGVIPTSQAMEIALEAGMDLVEVAPQERPPVCRIMDYGKFKYEQKKKATKNTKQHQVQVKEIRLRPKTGDHDVEFKIKRARGFLEDRDKVKINVLFRGREHAHRERGEEMIAAFIEQLDDVAKVEKPAGMEGRQMTAILSPR